MCLAVPGRIVSIDETGLMRMGRVDFGGITKDVSLAYVPEAVVNDYVVVHVGFALSRLDEEEALKTLALLEELAADPAGQSESS